MGSMLLYTIVMLTQEASQDEVRAMLPAPIVLYGYEGLEILRCTQDDNE